MRSSPGERTTRRQALPDALASSMGGVTRRQDRLQLSALGLLRFARGLHLKEQQVVQAGPNDCDRRKFADLLPGGRNYGRQNVGAELELQRQREITARASIAWR